jgi:hypothetical protein
MSQQSVRQEARRSALDAAEGTGRPRTPAGGTGGAALTALGERDGAVKDAEQRAGEALRAMSDDEGLSVRETVDWCGAGITVER